MKELKFHVLNRCRFIDCTNLKNILPRILLNSSFSIGISAAVTMRGLLKPISAARLLRSFHHSAPDIHSPVDKSASNDQAVHVTIKPAVTITMQQ